MAGKNIDYISWDEYFMGIALLSSLRSKDPSNQVGACIVKNNRILTCGYNGATHGFSDELFPWDSLGEQTGDILTIKNTFVVHAEQNAIDNFRGDKKELENSTLYVTWFPCNECAKRIVQNGIKKVVYARMYSDSKLVEATKRMFSYANIEVVEYKDGADKTEIITKQKELKTLTKNFASKKDMTKF